MCGISEQLVGRIEIPRTRQSVPLQHRLESANFIAMCDQTAGQFTRLLEDLHDDERISLDLAVGTLLLEEVLDQVVCLRAPDSNSRA